MTAPHSISLSEILAAVGGKLLHGDEAGTLPLVINTDTRSLKEGELFIALKGEQFDAHRFLAQAAQKGAALLIGQTDPTAEMDSWPLQPAIIQVPDSLQALQDLARYWRTQLTDRAVGITGSNGKTSTKDLAAAVLRQRYQTGATQGNFNNHIGLPLTVLRNTRETQATLYEMGMNHAGEIAPLCDICKPQVGIITSIGTAHIEHLGSVEAIAREKGALAAALPPEGTLLLPADLPHRALIESMTEATVWTTSLEGNADFHASDIESTQTHTTFTLHLPDGDRAPVRLPLHGRHMVSNALLAAGLGYLYALRAEEIAQGLAAVSLSSGRLRQFHHSGHRILDDTYNANPDSMRAAIRTLREQLSEETTGYLILGKMGELGEHAEASHLAVGAYAAQHGLPLLSVGPGAQLLAEGAKAGPLARHFETRQEAAEWITKHLPAGSTLLFKGSRAAQMELLMHALFPESSP